MRYILYSFILCCFLNSASYAQPGFRSIDTLLIRNFEAVSQKDTAYYISLLNLSRILPAKGLKSRSDSLKALKPFTEAFSDMSAELREFAGVDDIEVKFDSYTSANTAYYDSKVQGKIMLQVSLLINNTFTVKVPFMIMADKGVYTIEYPMMVMFAE